MVKNRKNKNQDNILVIAAHPDDEILGCGGSICKWKSEGKKINIVILAEGITSRSDKRNVSKSETELKKLREKSKKVGKIIGADSVEFLGLPDNRMDTLPLLDIIKKIENIIYKLKPNIVLTHHAYDLNVDHRIANIAVLTACRPEPNSFVKKIMTFETPSSTDWSDNSQNTKFNPNFFVDINYFLDIKIKALKVYDSEMRVYPHARSYRHIKTLANYRGNSVGLKAAEALMIIREIS